MLALLCVLALFVGMYLAQAMLYTKYGIRQLSYRCRFDREEVQEGDTLTLTEEIENHGFLPLPWVKSEYSVSKYLDFAGTHSIVTGETRFVSSLFFLRGHARICRQWKVKALLRGEYRVEQVLLVSSDLLGAARASQAADDLGNMLTVLPLPSDTLPPMQESMNLTMGERTVPRSLLTDPMSVADVRPYTGYESLRRMDWNASARTGELMTRTEEPVQARRVHILLTAQQGEYGKRFVSRDVCEDTIRLCVRVFADLTSSGEPFSVQSNCTVHGALLHEPEGCSAALYHTLRRALAAIDLNPEQNLRDIADIPAQARLIIIASYESEDVRRLRAKHPDAAVLLLS